MHGSLELQWVFIMHIFCHIAYYTVLRRMGNILVQEIPKSETRKFNNVERRDFFWDRFIIYISSSIIALTVLSASVEFFRGGSGVSCLIPLINRDQVAFLTQFCVDSLPITEHFPVYLLAHGLSLIIPHYMWSSIFKSHFDSFFSVATSIEYLRKGEKGEYSEEDFSRVEKLKKIHGNAKIFLWFMGKLTAQLIISFYSFWITFGWFFIGKRFSVSFTCDVTVMDGAESILDDWPENITEVSCVYPTFRILYVALILDMILTYFVAILAICGLMWCITIHWKELGHKVIAEFAFQSLLEPKSYAALFYSITVEISFKRYGISLSSDQIIRNDLDFLTMALYASDNIYGRAFTDILVS